MTTEKNLLGPAKFKQAILLLSGGIDSTTVLALLSDHGVDVTCLIFDYGQSLHEEITIARANAEHYGARSLVIPAPLNWLAPGCSLLNPDVPITTGRTRGEIQESPTPSSYVPFRNGIFFAYAIAFGEAQGIPDLFGGCNGLASGKYWDDTKEFADAISQAGRIGTDPSYRPQIHVPFAEITKAQIVAVGLQLGVDYTKTWSCYQNGTNHCSVCDSCVQRAAAFEEHHLDLSGSPL